MIKGNKKYIFILTICFTALILLQTLAPKPINWNKTYVKKDKIPFGTSALYDVLPSIFPGQEIYTETLTIYNSLTEENSINTNYIVINSSFEPDKLDTRELLKFAEEGNTVFVAANYFSGKFADTLKLETDDYVGIAEAIETDSIQLNKFYNPYDTASINFVNPTLKRKQNYDFSKGIENTYFTSFDSSKIVILGTNISNKINFIKIKWGKGTIILSTVPEVFTNYLFVNAKNYDYVYKALSYLPNQKTIWDEYYKAGNVKQESELRVIFSNPALLTAYYLLIGSLLIFIIIGIKRKQRIIPDGEPLRNTTLDFVDIVGTLYYQTGNHKNIADKKITYFLEYVRSAFQVKTSLYDDAFINRITNLSGIDRQKVHDLFYYFADLSIKQSITQQELLKLNRMIELFHKENKR
ncbi:DUF4350 domain-containing protein [soil metagenome]